MLYIGQAHVAYDGSVGYPGHARARSVDKQ